MVKRRRRKSTEPSPELEARFAKLVKDANIEVIKEIRATKDRAHKTIGYGIIAALIAAFISWALVEARSKSQANPERETHAKIEKADIR